MLHPLLLLTIILVQSEPSDADRKITKNIYDAGNLVDIKLLDHIIVLPVEGFLSFADAGYIYYEG